MAAPVPPVMRLGEAVKPLAYDAELTIVPDAETFEGRMAIDIDIAQSRDFFWINATGLDIRHAVLVAGERSLPAEIVPGNADFVGFRFPAVLPVGKARLTIDYSGRFSINDTRGLFRQKDGAEWYAFSQFEPLNARRAFPCFDEPHWKTPWTLTLTVRREHVAVANMPVATEENIGTDMKRVRFAATPPLPSYLVALGVGPFDVVEGGVAGRNNTTLRYITPKGRGAEARYAVKTTPALLNLLEDYFGRPYPFAKIDSMVIPVTVNFGAMENVGLITYRSNILLASPEREDERFQQRYASIAAHEMAHQWFGDLVTMAWWNDLWLNESFATWMARKTVERFNPAWNAQEQRESERHKAMQTDRLASTRQVRQPIASRDDLANAFDSITYDKGGAVLTMFETWLGETRFRDGVRRYLDRHAFGNATAEDFFAALSESEPAFATAFSSFVEQAGVPHIALALDCSGAPALRVHQERFLPGMPPTGTAQQQWMVPYCVRYAGQKSDKPYCVMLSGKQASLPLPEATSCPAWVLPNPSGSGYFLSSMAPALLNGLSHASLNASEAVALSGDMTMLAYSAALPQDQVLRMAARLAADARPEVAKAAADAAASVHPAMLGKKERIRLARWLSRHFGKRAKALGWLPQEADSDATRALRVALLPLLAETGADPVLRVEAKRHAMQWLGRKNAPKLGGMLRPVLQSAAYSGDQALFDALVTAAATSRESGDRNVIFHALGSFTSPALLQQSMNLALSDRFDPREAVTILRTASESPENAQAVNQFVRQHYDALLARLPEDYGALLPKWGNMLCSRSERDTFDSFHRQRAALHPGGTRNFLQALETIDLCLANRRMQGGKVKRYLAASR
ncbi:MAG TPA: M1 family metallopeptidase [Burkholderiaceae bacterium]|nr:M1 family metallopeptidase [Burkholderiaceae bacterium]